MQAATGAAQVLATYCMLAAAHAPHAPLPDGSAPPDTLAALLADHVLISVAAPARRRYSHCAAAHQARAAGSAGATAAAAGAAAAA